MRHIPWPAVVAAYTVFYNNEGQVLRAAVLWCRQVLECLREHVDELRPSCTRLLFRRQQQSLILPRADYFLFHACKAMIIKYCSGPDGSGAQLLDCLKVSLRCCAALCAVDGCAVRTGLHVRY